MKEPWDPAAPWKPAAFTRYNLGDSIRTTRYAYTEFVNQKDEVLEAMLYDLQYDPDENYNIVDANPALQKRLSSLLGHGPEGKRNAWRALVDESRDNTPTATPLHLPAAIHPADYEQKLATFRP